MAIDRHSVDLTIPQEINHDAPDLELPKKRSAKDLELERLQKRLAYIERKIEETDERKRKLDGEYVTSMSDFKQRETRRSDYFVEKVRTTVANTRKNLQKSPVGSLLDKCTFQLLGKTDFFDGYKMLSDEAEDVADIRDGANVRALQGVIAAVGEKDALDGLEHIEDPHVRATMQRLRTQSLMYQHYSYNYQDHADNNLVLGAPLVSLGYRWFGPAGALIVTQSILNRAQASQASYYQMQQMARNMEVDELRMTVDSNAYTLNHDQTWLTFENFRAAAAKDLHIPRSRGEFQNVANPIYAEMGKMYNMEHDYGAQFEYNRTKNNGEQSRLLLDMLTSLGTKINGGK